VHGEINIHGTTANGWDFVRDLFKENFAQERDLGGSVAIYYQGRLVVDRYGGWFDQTRTKPYDNDTLQLVFSTTKGLVAVAAALCVQRGLLNYSELVTKYWPEYGQHGKENTTVADILSHRAGLPIDASPFERYLNWTAMIHTLEQQEPIWLPGTAHGYHALTYGWLAGELIRRVDPMRRSVGQFIRDEIATPIQIEFYIGLPSDQEYRVSPLDGLSSGNMTSNDSTTVSDNEFNDWRTHQAEIPAANGISNARSVARLYASLIGDVEDNKYKRILNEEILKQAIKSNTPQNEIDLVLNMSTRFGMGFRLMDESFPSLGPGVFGHNGFGGSIGFAAPTKMYNYWAQQQQQAMADYSRASRAPRVVVINERDPIKSAQKLVAWLDTHYPNHKIIQMARIKQNQRIYNRVVFQTAQGQRNMVVFDVNALYLNNMGTATEMFSNGTMVRISPGTGSTPTRMQVLY
ncbi:unnamed protein product, partial [Adineta steineri]